MVNFISLLSLLLGDGIYHEDGSLFFVVSENAYCFYFIWKEVVQELSNLALIVMEQKYGDSSANLHQIRSLSCGALLAEPLLARPDLAFPQRRLRRSHVAGRLLLRQARGRARAVGTTNCATRSASSKACTYGFIFVDLLRYARSKSTELIKEFKFCDLLDKFQLCSLTPKLPHLAFCDLILWNAATTHSIKLTCQKLMELENGKGRFLKVFNAAQLWETK
ncbi:hypothetical protein AXF42_Ash003324 [Apostasia shenzhenica]|uniref:Uncharacterized protein n=1 Tax=Apostasia shenzhenica TaxID=1088818 RepID=A0A2I0BFV8_9ASPA|nr:hypothetical protein AXF42_Ash003324 [Apostasia shenzhenica]